MHYYTCSFGPTRMYMLKKRVDIVRPTRKMIENPVKYVHEWEAHEEIMSRLHDQKVRDRETDKLEDFCKIYPWEKECKIFN